MRFHYIVVNRKLKGYVWANSIEIAIDMIQKNFNISNKYDIKIEAG
jgi:hypothetical protein